MQAAKKYHEEGRLQVRRLLVLAAFACALAASQASAATKAVSTCNFTTKGTVLSLAADCTTDSTILVPNGLTLDGKKHTITAVDPAGSHFVGAVVKNAGSSASVKNLTVTVSGLADVCDAGVNRLRGIMLDGASGTITHNVVTGVTQVGSGCQEGSSIEARNCDGAPHATVQIDHNTVSDFMKTGILANCDLTATIEDNTVGASANQAALAANSIQLGFGAAGSISRNTIDGNQWCTLPGDDATAILLYENGSATVDHNKIGGNSDIAIYIGGDHTVVNDNNITDDSSIADCNVNHDDIAIGNYGSDLPGGDPTTNNVTHNTVSGFTTPFDGPVGKHNKVKPAKPTP
jgi:hypothetical protein